VINLFWLAFERFCSLFPELISSLSGRMFCRTTAAFPGEPELNWWELPTSIVSWSRWELGTRPWHEKIMKLIEFARTKSTPKSTSLPLLTLNCRN
jgi:hypothetical protein